MVLKLESLLADKKGKIQWEIFDLINVVTLKGFT